MPVEGLYPCQELAIIATGNEDLGMRTDGCLEDRERSGGELMLLEQRDLIFSTERRNTISSLV